MSYTPQTWVNGDIITATKLNNIESGVQSVSNSYTPTTWVNGDIITATKLNNIEQGIANAGGGGSSDFTTAEVTIVNNTSGYSYVPGWWLENDTPSSEIYIAENTTTDVVLVLYKGSNNFGIGNGTVTVSGDATATPNPFGGALVSVTGDCTITIS